MQQQASIQRLQLARAKLALPLGLFLSVACAYAACVVAILIEPLWASVILVPVCGALVIMLFVIGHDACHQSFTSSPLLNHIIGRMAFLPAVHSFSLWDREHNLRHHRFNNIKHLDYVWAPLTPTEFARAGPWQRFRYRFYRTPGGVFFYYLFDLWPQRLLVPRRHLVGRVRSIYVADCAFLAITLAVYATTIAAVGHQFGKGAILSIALTLVLPFLIFMPAISAAIFLHHTHYDVPWYSSRDQWRERLGAVYGTVHVEFPTLFRWLILNIMVHNAHHYAPRVPLYRLAEMQGLVETPQVTKWRFSVEGYVDICARCKLFDYDNCQWLDFAGNATGGAGLRGASASANISD